MPTTPLHVSIAWTGYLDLQLESGFNLRFKNFLKYEKQSTSLYFLMYDEYFLDEGGNSLLKVDVLPQSFRSYGFQNVAKIDFS